MFSRTIRSKAFIKNYRNFAMSAQGTPIILCGRMEKVGKPVVDGLKPDYDVVYFVPTDEDGVENIPRLLTGQTPINQVSKIGSGNYSSVPVAIVYGAGYQEENIAKFRSALEATPNARKVPMCRADMEKRSKTGVPPGTEDYAAYVLGLVKDLLNQLKEQGKLDGNYSGNHYY